MGKTPGWQRFERDVQETLGLDATICSGNKWHDQGDAVDNRPPAEDDFRLMADCKSTDKASRSINQKEWRQGVHQAVEKGKRFIMPIRIWPRGDFSGPTDVVVIGIDDFAELLEKSKELQRLKAGYVAIQKDIPLLSRAAVDRTYLEREEYRSAWF